MYIMSSEAWEVVHLCQSYYVQASVSYLLFITSKDRVEFQNIYNVTYFSCNCVFRITGL